MNVGLSFAPTSQSLYGHDQGSANPVQDAIRILSFRMPSVLGSGAATPMQNLGGPSQYGTQLGSAVIQNFLRSILRPGDDYSSYSALFNQGGGAPPHGTPPGVSIVLGNPMDGSGISDQPTGSPMGDQSQAPPPMPPRMPRFGGGMV